MSWLTTTCHNSLLLIVVLVLLSSDLFPCIWVCLSRSFLLFLFYAWLSSLISVTCLVNSDFPLFQRFIPRTCSGYIFLDRVLSLRFSSYFLVRDLCCLPILVIVSFCLCICYWLRFVGGFWCYCLLISLGVICFIYYWFTRLFCCW